MTTQVEERVQVDGAAAKILQLADADLVEFYDELLQNGSPVWDGEAKAWLVLEHDQCVEAEASEDIFGNIYMNADPILVELKGGTANITVSQGELHDRLRKFHLTLLSARAVKSYREKHIEPIIDYVIDRIRPNGKADLRTEYVQQVVPRVICSLMGMPWRDDKTMARILELNDAIVEFIGNNYQGDTLKDNAIAASKELNEMLLPYVRERRDNPADDFISRIWQEAPEAYGDDLTEDDAVAICRELYFAASDTTNHGASNALYILLTDQDVREQVYSDPQKLGVLIEEALRLYNVVQMRHRIAKTDTEINGRNIRAGELVLMCHATANRDTAHHACPHAAKLDRERPAAHLAFGRGPRSCVGMQLARSEMHAMLTAIMAKLPNVRLDSAAEPPVFSGGYMRSYKPLNVVWDI